MTLRGQARLESTPIRLAFNDQIIGVAREAIDGTLCTDGVRKRREPVARATVGGHDDRPGAVPPGANVNKASTPQGTAGDNEGYVHGKEADGTRLETIAVE